MGEKYSMRRAVVCVVWLGALAVPACGGSSSGSGSASCSGDTTCGGDVVGTWKIDAACASLSADTSGMTANCPGASIDTSGLTITGTFTFGADKTYSSSLVEGGSVHYSLPNSCLTMNGQTVTCDELGTAFTSAGDTFSSASCKTSGANCLCDLGTKPQTTTETGTYTVAGSALTMTASTGDVSTSSFCSKGNELHMADMDMGMTVGTIVATKQ
jgi:hypothetical protein